MRVFLSSSYSDVASLLPEVYPEFRTGLTVTRIVLSYNCEAGKACGSNDQEVLLAQGFNIDDLDITTSDQQTIETVIERNDALFISGENAFLLLQEVQRTRADQYISKHIRKGKLYIGVSAGAVITTPNIHYVLGINNPAKAPLLSSFRALNVIPFYPVPHVNQPPFTEKVADIIRKYEHLLELIPIQNSEAIYYTGKRCTVVDSIAFPQ
jgi:dipeptidase E